MPCIPSLSKDDTEQVQAQLGWQQYSQKQRASAETSLLEMYVRRWLSWAGAGLVEKQKPRIEAGPYIWIDNLSRLRCFTPAVTHTC